MKAIQYNNRGEAICIVEYLTDGEATAFLPDRTPSLIKVKDTFEVTDLPNILVANGQVIQRNPLPTQFTKLSVKADLSDVAHLEGLPAGTRVSIEQFGEVIVDDGVLDLVFSKPGAHKVELDPFPYRPFEVTINVN